MGACVKCDGTFQIGDALAVDVNGRGRQNRGRVAFVGRCVPTDEDVGRKGFAHGCHGPEIIAPAVVFVDVACLVQPAHRFAQAWAAGGLHIVDELAAPDLIVSYPLPPEPIRGAEAFKAFLAQFLAGLPDSTVTVDDTIAEGNRVACRWTMRGTHKGSLFGFPPTGRSVQISGFTFYRLANGKVVEETGIGNTLSLMQQLGAVVAPAQT